MPKALTKPPASEAEAEAGHKRRMRTLPVNRKFVEPPKSQGYARPMLTRTERAKIRILSQHGISQANIGVMVGRSLNSVGRALHRTAPRLRDADDDYDHVDEAFRAQFPPLATVRRKRGVKRDQQGDQVARTSVSADSVPSSAVTKTCTPGPPTCTTRLTQDTRSMSTQSQRKPLMELANSQSLTAPTGRRSEPIDLVSDDDDAPIPESIPESGPKSGSEALIDFLSGLAHDIAWVHEHLERQDLGTLEKLLAVADWPEEDLHMMFREALPGVGVPQRFVLVRGLKDRYVGMEGAVEVC